MTYDKLIDGTKLMMAYNNLGHCFYLLDRLECTTDDLETVKETLRTHFQYNAEGKRRNEVLDFITWKRERLSAEFSAL